VVGFEKGLHEWKRLLKPGGYMVIHDEEGNLEEKLQTAKTYGYEMLDYILLDKNTWRQEYYAPLKQLVEKTIAAYDDNEEIRRMVENDRSEIEWFDNNPGQNSSVIFVMKMTG
jgi:ubiquinone/menaquinone biosynthesis C-methylase UbiE